MIVHRLNILRVGPPLFPHIVSDLQRGLVDEEQRSLHEVQQTALGLVHAADVGRAARGVEGVGGV